MPRSTRDLLHEHYQRLSNRFVTTNRSGDYARLVVPAGNADEPFHRWFHVKEAFSSKLLGRIVKDDGLNDRIELRLFDPFAGGGTTLLSGLLGSPGWSGSVRALGVERNPFLQFVASTKIAAACADGERVAADLRSAVKVVLASAGGLDEPVVPDQATLRNPLHYPPEALGSLLRLRVAAEQLDDGLTKDLLLLCVATSLEPCGYLRRDGRALRYDPARRPLAPHEAFGQRVDEVLADLIGNPGSHGAATVVLGDARDLHGSDASFGFDLALFSPPYPNNIDYTEVYKTEAWLMGLYADQAAFRAQRHGTLRSHPSVLFRDEYSYRARQDSRELDALVEPLLDVLPHDRYFNTRTRMLRGYVDDMLAVFQQCLDLALEDSRLVFVVGNSAHGKGHDRFEVAADLLLARAAEHAGWAVQEIRVARQLGRRGPGTEFMRESAVSLRPA